MVQFVPEFTFCLAGNFINEHWLSHWCTELCSYSAASALRWVAVPVFPSLHWLLHCGTALQQVNCWCSVFRCAAVDNDWIIGNTAELREVWTKLYSYSHTFSFDWSLCHQLLLGPHSYKTHMRTPVFPLRIFRLGQFNKFVYKSWWPCTKSIKFGLRKMAEWARKAPVCPTI